MKSVFRYASTAAPVSAKRTSASPPTSPSKPHRFRAAATPLALQPATTVSQHVYRDNAASSGCAASVDISSSSDAAAASLNRLEVTAVSQAAMDELLMGIDFDDDFGISPPASPSRQQFILHSPQHSPSPQVAVSRKASPCRSSSHSARPIPSHSTCPAHPLLPLGFSQSHIPSTFYSHHRSSSAWRPTMSKASFATTAAKASNDVEDDVMVLDHLGRMIDVPTSSSGGVQISLGSRAAKESVASGLKVKAQKVIKIDSGSERAGGDESDLEITVRPRRKRSTSLIESDVDGSVTPATASKVGSIGKITTTAISSASVAKKPMSKTMLLKLQRASRIEVLSQRKKVKSDRLAKLVTLNPFDFSTWPSPPELVFTFDETKIKATLDAMVERGSKVFGWDLEWEVLKQRGAQGKTALVQICDEKTILLVQSSRMRAFSPSLATFLSNPAFFKVGVCIGGDGRKLQRDFNVLSAGLLELTTVARELDRAAWVDRAGLIGLQDQVGNYLRRYLDKDIQVRTGKWEATLDLAQRTYAANDVFSSLQVFLALSSLSSEPLDVDRLATAITPLGSTESIAKLTARRNELSASRPLGRSTEFRPKPTSRQLEAYRHFATTELNAEQVADLMSATPNSATIKPISALWNLLGALDRDPALKMDDSRLLDLVRESFGSTKQTMMSEFTILLGEAQDRELERMIAEKEKL